ncbi:MAG: exonuclease SbcCD subunit D [Eubacteriales bacterium]|nr:exonuclease SbcCD subunit D [Eubacteriales bacterium]
MKIFHLSDLHIGLKLMNRDLGEDQRYILGEIVRIAAERSPDAVVIAGDIYDRPVPSAEAVEIFDAFVSSLSEALPKAEIMMISGNHDSAARVNIFRSILRKRKLHMIGHPPVREEEHIEKIIIEDEYGPVNFYLLPFVRPSMVRQITGTNEDGSSLTYNEAVRRLIERESIDRKERNVLVSHQFYLPAGRKAEEIERAESEIRTVGNIDEVGADILEIFDYAALGHIHKPMALGKDTLRYCGTPIACSVSESGQKKGIIEVTLGEKGSIRTETIPLSPLREIRVIKGLFRDVLLRGCSDYVTVILTDREELNAADLQDRLRNAFPNLLEIRREGLRKADYTAADIPEEEPDPYELCCGFLGDTDEAEREMLKSVINSVRVVWK